jgi:acyl carrier protein
MSVNEETYAKVSEVLIDALGVEDDEVTPDATMIEDLGAESIDFLDIVFKLEQTFGISIDREELFPDDILTSSEFLQDGKVTAEGVAKLKERMPFANLDKFEENPVVQDFANLLTVSDLCRFVEHKKA